MTSPNSMVRMISEFLHQISNYPRICLLLSVSEENDATDNEKEKNKRNAKFTYLRGRALNVLPDHSPEAEQLLSKSVKLDPDMVKAWIELGECYWKRGDIDTAKTCFEGALYHVNSLVKLEGVSFIMRFLLRERTK